MQNSFGPSSAKSRSSVRHPHQTALEINVSGIADCLESSPPSSITPLTTLTMIATRLARPTLRAAASAARTNAGLTVSAVRAKHTLPDLSYDYAELEPSISGKIMEVRYP